MDADKIRDWSDQYDEHYPAELQSIENSIRSAIRKQGHLDSDQLEKVIRWKLAGQGGRADRFIEDMRDVPDGFVRKVTEAALLAEDEKIKIETISSIPGVGAATASVVLMFYDPAEYAVGDRYLKDEFLNKNQSMRATEYPKILGELRSRNPGTFDLRTIEKAYWMRYRVENDVGDWGIDQTV